MKAADERETILVLHRKGRSIREIARQLSMDRKTVARILRSPEQKSSGPRQDKIVIEEELLRRIYQECSGYVQRMHEKLTEEHQIKITYSTLTRKVRDLGLGRRVKERYAHVETPPGEEMQHDTSSYLLHFGDGGQRRITASMLYLRYSKMLYLKFYLRFQRFHMKCFFHEALIHLGYSARICVIDNTNLARLCGIGQGAEIQREMRSFAVRYGFEFLCHELGHSNRKGGEERSFWTTETNFLPGRSFRNIADLNAQALEWSTVRMSLRPRSKTSLIPAEAFETEKPHLHEVFRDIPAPSRPHHREVNPYGHIEFNGNHFWVPGEHRFKVTVLEYPDRLDLYRNLELLHSYRLPGQDESGLRFKPTGESAAALPKPRRRSTTHLEEAELRLMGQGVCDYLDFILKQAKGVARPKFIRNLQILSRRITSQLFLKTVERAALYEITDFPTIENIAELLLRQDGCRLPVFEVDPGLENRLAYQEGRVSGAPDFSSYETNLQQEENPEGRTEQKTEKPQA